MLGATSRSMFRAGAGVLFSALVVLTSISAYAAKQMEALDRGVVAVAANGGVLVSWRWLGLDSSGIAFNVYRNGVKLNASPISSRTNYFDSSGGVGANYQVHAVANGNEDEGSSAGAVWSAPYHRIPLQRPAGGTTPDRVSYSYSPNDAAVGDLDGDGEYEYIVKWYPSNAKDNSQSGYTGNTFIDAYKFNGQFLWRIDLGRNIRSGAHYTQFIVYDLDGDGKAEIAMKTADGTVDGRGNVIGNQSADHRNSSGYVLSGPEYLSIFNGQTGAEMQTVAYVPGRGNVSSWGDNYGNRVDRFLAGVAYLDGTRPSLIMARGVYTRSVIAAWDWRDGRLTQRWVFDTNNGYSTYAGQGAHSLSVGDVDNDGRDEIVYGAMTVDDNGRGLYSTRLGTGDALHLGDLNPQRPGQEVYMVHEEPAVYGSRGIEMHDARTGAILWSRSGNGEDVGRGVSMDIDPRYAGNENWASRNGLVAANGTQISSGNPSQINFGVFWDGDLLRELLDGESIDKWNYSAGTSSRLLSAANYGALSNNGSKATPALAADLFGDWREEVIWRHSNDRELLIFTTTTPSDYRLRSLMHDPQYRVAVAGQNVAYNQPPHTSFFLGNDMSQPPQPDIYYVGDNNPPDPEEGPIPDGSYTITSRLSAKALTVESGSSASGANVVQWSSGGSGGQVWELTETSAGRYEIVAAHSGKCLDLLDFSLENGANIIQWDCLGGNNQRWILQEVDNGYYTIASALSNKVLDVYNFVTTDGGNVVQWDNLQGENQQWMFEVAGGGNPETEITIQENAAGFCAVDGTVDSNYAGFTGTGFANTSNSSGAGVNWRINAASNGNYTVSFRYAAYTSQSARLMVNGSEVAQVSMPGTGGYTTWNEVSSTVPLAAGVQDIRLESSGAYGLGNLDFIKLRGGEVGPASCSGDVPDPDPDPDPEPEPDPDPLPTLTLTLQESAAGFCSVDGGLGSLARGYTGSGYANTDNATGAGVEWAVNIPADGNYQISIRYSASGSRSAVLLADGLVAANMAFPSTGSWSTWSTDTAEVFLSQGTHQLRLEATNSGGTALIDRFDITGAEPKAGNCR